MRFIPHLLLAASIVGVHATAHAQSVETLPPNMASTEGSASFWAPLMYTPARIQCGYAKQVTGGSGAKPILSLTARADGPRGQLQSAIKVDMAVWLSSRNIKWRCQSPTAANNHGNDRKLYIKKRSFSFQAFNASTPAPFNIVLKGDQPFVAIQELLVDWAVYGSSYQFNRTFYIDAHNGGVSGTNGSSRAYGTPCNPGMFWNYAWAWNVGDTFRTYGYTRNRGDVYLMWLSPKRVSVSIGNGCSLYADPFAPGTIFFPPQVTTRADGYMSCEWGRVPAALNGKRIWSQAFALGAQGQVRWSRGQETTFGNQQPTLQMGNRYNYATTVTPFDPDKDVLFWGTTGQAAVFKVN